MAAKATRGRELLFMDFEGEDANSPPPKREGKKEGDMPSSPLKLKRERGKGEPPFISATKGGEEREGKREREASQRRGVNDFSYAQLGDREREKKREGREARISTSQGLKRKKKGEKKGPGAFNLLSSHWSAMRRKGGLE